MKLKYFQVENYRSIIKTQQLDLHAGLTVILGPNNEGKTNLMNAISIAMKCLRSTRTLSFRRVVVRETPNSFVYPSNTYDWSKDYPLTLQSKKTAGLTKLMLGFELSDADKERFKKTCGSVINENLEIELTLDKNDFQVRVLKKRGKGAESYKGKVREICTFIADAFEFQYIEAVRTSQMSLDVIADLLDRELRVLRDQAEYKEALETLQKLEKPVIDSISIEVQTHLQKLLPSVLKVELSSSAIQQSRRRTGNLDFIVNDGTATQLEAKGDGVKSLVAISLLRAAKTGERFGDLVVAIEEPEAHLHPRGVKQLASVLNEMALEHQVIITTHSPYLVDVENISANIIVSKANATPSSSIQEIRDTLGVEVSDNLMHVENVILVEGAHDKTVYKKLLPILSDKFAQLLRERKINFDELNGTKNANYKVDLIKAMIARPILLLDDDDDGRQALRKITEAKSLNEKHIFSIISSARDHSELEDLIDHSKIWSELNEKFGVCISLEEFLDGRDKWSTRMKREFQKAGKPYPSTVQSNLKEFVANKVSEAGVEILTSEGLEQLTKIANAICILASSK